MLQVELEIGADPAEVGRARRWARSRLAGAGIGAGDPLAETLVLLVSELVTNAVVHTGRPAVLRLLLPARHAAAPLRIEVVDASGRPPRQRQADADDAHGRGLELVAGLASRWGWRRLGPGKSLWCELDRLAGAAESGAADSAADGAADRAVDGAQGAAGADGTEVAAEPAVAEPAAAEPAVTAGVFRAAGTFGA